MCKICAVIINTVFDWPPFPHQFCCCITHLQYFHKLLDLSFVIFFSWLEWLSAIFVCDWLFSQSSAEHLWSLLLTYLSFCHCVPSLATLFWSRFMIFFLDLDTCVTYFATYGLLGCNVSRFISQFQCCMNLLLTFILPYLLTYLFTFLRIGLFWFEATGHKKRPKLALFFVFIFLFYFLAYFVMDACLLFVFYLVF